MKKKLLIIMAVLMLFACVFAACNPGDGSRPNDGNTGGGGNPGGDGGESGTEVLQYELIDGVYTVTRYQGNASDVTISAEHDGKTVAAIGRYAFHSCSTLTNITIPDSVTSIGENAFV